MNTNRCLCGSFVMSLVLALAWGAAPACADADATNLPGYSASRSAESEAVPLPVELKAEERHERPPMTRSYRRDNRAVENVMPQLAVPGNSTAGEAGASSRFSGFGVMAPSAFSPAAPSSEVSGSVVQGSKVQNSMTQSSKAQGSAPELPKQKTVKIHSRTLVSLPATVSPVEAVIDPQTVQLGDMMTAWGYGPRENKYNAAILNAAQKCWPHQRVPLHPLLFKSLVANESAFNPSAVSYTGATGLTQLTPDTMRRFGLNWSSSRDPQKAVPAGVKVLAEKARVILEPQNYAKITGLSPARCPYAQLVADAYQQYGEPSTEQSYYLMLAAYNAGGGTILRAMAKAYKQGRDPREWSNLVGDPNNKSEAPLFKACQEIFPRSASAKYREIAAYPEKIMKLYYRSQARLI